MKWFMHMSDSLFDPFVSEVIEKFGGDGYLTYFGTVTLMAREFDVKDPGKAKFSERFLKKNLQISGKKLELFYRFFEKKGKIFALRDGDYYLLNCPKLKEIADNFTKKMLRKKYEVTTK